MYEENESQEPELWQLHPDAEGELWELADFVASLIDGRRRDCYTIQGLARLLVALRRLPAYTSGVCLTLTMGLREGNESRYCALEFGNEGLSLTTGGSFYDPAVGGDTFSDQLVRISPSGLEEGDWYGIHQWTSEAESLLGMKGDVSVEDLNDGDGIDWDEDAGEVGWEAIRRRAPR